MVFSYWDQGWFMPVAATRRPLTRASKSPSPTMRNHARRGWWSSTNSLRNMGHEPLLATPAGGAIHCARSNSAPAAATVVRIAEPITKLGMNALVLMGRDGCEVSYGSYLPTLSVVAAEVRINSRRLGAAPLD